MSFSVLMKHSVPTAQVTFTHSQSTLLGFLVWRKCAAVRQQMKLLWLAWRHMADANFYSLSVPLNDKLKYYNEGKGYKPSLNDLTVWCQREWKNSVRAGEKHLLISWLLRCVPQLFVYFGDRCAEFSVYFFTVMAPLNLSGCLWVSKCLKYTITSKSP